MNTFNRIEQNVYTTLKSPSFLSDGSVQVEYVIGIGTEEDDKLGDFRQLASQWFTIEQTKADEIANAPLTKDDLGKSPNQILLDRFYNYLKETGSILI